MTHQLDRNCTAWVTEEIISQMANNNNSNHLENSKLPGLLFITSYPPKQCGIATYTQDLVQALQQQFFNSFNISICPLESENEQHTYEEEPDYVLNVDEPHAFSNLAAGINSNNNISLVILQHEFGFFQKNEQELQQLLQQLSKPVIIIFHTVLPHPNPQLRENVKQLTDAASAIIVMTNFSSTVLINDYEVVKEKITVIPHGTHLVLHKDKNELKKKYNLTGKEILSTFGLLSSGKSIETTLDALPAVIQNNPDVLFLIIGKTHPTVLKKEGERYRNLLKERVEALNLNRYVQFINEFVPLNELLEYLQLTDIYLFTSKDPNQAVSGTFSYALSCGCAVISTPIPHAKEVLGNDTGILFNFGNSVQLADAIQLLLNDEQLRINMGSAGLHRMSSTAWQNSAIAHAQLFKKTSKQPVELVHRLPDVHTSHLKKLTTGFGMIQFCKLNQPDISTGYTLDDNARALVAFCQHYQLTREEEDLKYIRIYLRFIQFCIQPSGYFLNYVNADKKFTAQNHETNLDDANGRAIWALGHLLSLGSLFPDEITNKAENIIQLSLKNIQKIRSTRAMAFVIKGLYYRDTQKQSVQNLKLIRELANRLVQMFRHEADDEWQWFESYLTYANSILPEAMLCAWACTSEPIYRDIAKKSFDFLLSRIFNSKGINVISNKTWLHRQKQIIAVQGGEQPIDVAYTIIALNKFFNVYTNTMYSKMMTQAFSWFVGANHLQQIIYNPCTGGCYDGLEENYVNLNQGAESTVSYLMARLTIAQFYAAENHQTDTEKKHYFVLNIE